MEQETGLTGNRSKAVKCSKDSTTHSVQILSADTITEFAVDSSTNVTINSLPPESDIYRDSVVLTT